MQAFLRPREKRRGPPPPAEPALPTDESPGLAAARLALARWIALNGPVREFAPIDVIPPPLTLSQVVADHPYFEVEADGVHLSGRGFIAAKETA